MSLWSRLVRNALVVLVVVGAVPWVASAQTGLARVAIYPVRNETGRAELDAVCEALYGTVEMNLALLGKYELVAPKGEGPRGADASPRVLGEVCERGGVDSLVYGNAAPTSSGGVRFSLSVFDRFKSAVTVSRTADAPSIFDVFDAADRLSTSLVEGFSGVRLAFGTLTIRNSGTKGPYRVRIGGKVLGENLGSVPRLLAGTHSVEIEQDRLVGKWQTTVKATVKEGAETPIDFSPPELTPEEDALLAAEEARLRGAWLGDSKAVSAATEMAQRLRDGFRSLSAFAGAAERAKGYERWLEIAGAEIGKPYKSEDGPKKWIPTGFNDGVQLIFRTGGIPGVGALSGEIHQGPTIDTLVPRQAAITVDGDTREWSNVAEHRDFPPSGMLKSVAVAKDARSLYVKVVAGVQLGGNHSVVVILKGLKPGVPKQHFGYLIGMNKADYRTVPSGQSTQARIPDFRAVGNNSRTEFEFAIPLDKVFFLQPATWVAVSVEDWMAARRPVYYVEGPYLKQVSDEERFGSK